MGVQQRGHPPAESPLAAVSLTGLLRSAAEVTAARGGCGYAVGAISPAPSAWEAAWGRRAFPGQPVLRGRLAPADWRLGQ